MFVKVESNLFGIPEPKQLLHPEIVSSAQIQIRTFRNKLLRNKFRFFTKISYFNYRLLTHQLSSLANGKNVSFIILIPSASFKGADAI